MLKPVAPPSAAQREEKPPLFTDVLECPIDIPPPDELEWDVDGTPPPDEAYWEYDIENPPPRTDHWGFETPPLRTLSPRGHRKG